MDRKIWGFFALTGAAPAAVAFGAAFLLLGAMTGRHVLWQATDADLASAIRADSAVAVEVFVEALPDIDTPIAFSHPRILDSRPLELAPLAIALMHNHSYIVKVLRDAGSDPATALSRISPETAAALRNYAIDTKNSLAIEYLTKFRTDATGAPAAPSPAPGGIKH
jgi:hypothetical protein